MSRKAKKRGSGGLWPLGIAALVLSAVLVGMFLPSLSSGIQTRRLEGLTEVPELGAGELSLASDDIKIERLSMISALNNASRNAPIEQVELSGGRYMSAEDAVAKLDEVLALIDGTGLNIGSISRKNLDWADAVLLVGQNGNPAGVVMWEVLFTKTSGPVHEWLNYVVDESTGILAYINYGVQDISAYESVTAERISRVQSHNMQALVDNMAKSYNFVETRLVPQEVEDATAVQDGIYYVSFLENDQLMLNIQISFNGSSWTINA